MQYLDPKKMVINSLVVNQGSKGDDFVLASDSDGLVSWKATSVYTNNKDYDHYIGELFGGGVVVAVWRDGNVEKCLVASIQDVASVLTTVGDLSTSYSNNYLYPWSNVSNAVSSATHSSYGATNSALILGQVGIDNTRDPYINEIISQVSGFSAAARWTDVYVNADIGYGTFNDWYLPSIFELSALASNMMIVNKVLYQLCVDKGISLIDVATPGVKAGNIPSLVTLVTGDYWSSTEKDATTAYYLNTTTGKIQSSPKFSWNFLDYQGNMRRVRPFRIATDNQVSFKFEAEWIIISYKFLDGVDLDTRTRMIYPNSTSHPTLITPWNESVAYNAGVNGGPKSVNFMGHTSMIPWATSQGDGAAQSYTPNITETIPAPNGFYNGPGQGNNITGTYSIMRWGGDVRGDGGYPTSYESILVNVNAFKFHFPGVDTIRIDCRGWWYGTRGSTVVRLGVNMHKGGNPILTGGSPSDPGLEQWDVPNSTSNLSLDSLDVPAQSVFNDSNPPSPTPEGVQGSTRIAIVEYNINTKIGKIIT